MSNVIRFSQRKKQLAIEFRVRTVYEDENMALLRIDVGGSSCYLPVPYTDDVTIEEI